MPLHLPRPGPRVRQVGKVVLAAVAAYSLSQGERNEYALFAALGAAMVVGGSLGEDLRASLVRVRGTLAGTAVGIAAAELLGTSLASLGLVVGALAWLCVGLGWGAPAMRVGFAMALVVLFTHGTDPAHYALWRAANTLIGVVTGLAVSLLVWPLRGREEVESALAQLHSATAELLAAVAGGATPESLLQKQTQVLDALTSARTARRNAALEPRWKARPDSQGAQVRRAARAALASLAASLELVPLTARAGETLLADVRREFGELAEMARGRTAAQATGASALAEAARAAQVDPELRALLEGLAAQLRLVRHALAEEPAEG